VNKGVPLTSRLYPKVDFAFRWVRDAVSAEFHVLTEETKSHMIQTKHCQDRQIQKTQFLISRQNVHLSAYLACPHHLFWQSSHWCPKGNRCWWL